MPCRKAGQRVTTKGCLSGHPLRVEMRTTAAERSAAVLCVLNACFFAKRKEIFMYPYELFWGIDLYTLMITLGVVVCLMLIRVQGDMRGLRAKFQNDVLTLVPMAVDTKHATTKMTITEKRAGTKRRSKSATAVAPSLPRMPANTPAHKKIKIMVMMFLSATPFAITDSFSSKESFLF